MSRDWADERYVRLFVRDTVTWDGVPWQARCVLPLLLRKVDRNGELELGRRGLEGLARTVDVPVEVVEPAIRAWVDEATVILVTRGVTVSFETAWAGDPVTLRIPNFRQAQDCTKNAAERSKAYRARQALERKGFVTNRHAQSDERDASRAVTNRHEKEATVTKRHAQRDANEIVTPPVPPVPPVQYRETERGLDDFDDPPLPPEEAPPESPSAPSAGADLSRISPSAPKPEKSQKSRRVPPPPSTATPEELDQFCWTHQLPTVAAFPDVAAMLDYHRARGAASSDWLATWRTWERRAQDHAARAHAKVMQADAKANARAVQYDHGPSDEELAARERDAVPLASLADLAANALKALGGDA